MPNPSAVTRAGVLSETLSLSDERGSVSVWSDENVTCEAGTIHNNSSDYGGEHVEPAAELQIETLSTPSAKFFLNSWYGALVVALVLQSFVSLQWGMVNICDNSAVSIGDMDSWSSSCVEKFAFGLSDINRSGVQVVVQVPNAKQSSPHGTTFPSLLGRGMPTTCTGGSLNAERCPQSWWNWHCDEALQRKRRYNLRWVGINRIDILAGKLNRFPRVVLSLASPQEAIPGDIPFETYELQVALTKFPVSVARKRVKHSNCVAVEERAPRSTQFPAAAYTYNTTTTCFRTTPRCTPVVLPRDVAVVGEDSGITLTIIGVEEELAAVASTSSVGVAYQRSAYTVFTIVCRYTFILTSITHLAFFLYRTRQTRTIYEHYWVTALNVVLILYLDPFFAAGIYDEGGVELYRFFEYHIPNYFVAFLSCFIFALVGASINASEEVEAAERRRRDGDSQVADDAVTGQPGPFPKPGAVTDGSHLSFSSSCCAPGSAHREEEDNFLIHKPYGGCGQPIAADSAHPLVEPHCGMPLWVTVSVTCYFVALVGLDVGRAFVENWDWGTVADCLTFYCHYLASMFYAMLLLLVLASNVLLIWLKHNLGRRPYLEDRPRQLACRVFIFVFSSAMVYFIVQAVLIDVLYPQVVRIIVYQPFSQLAPVMVSFFFVSHITFVYTPTTASRRVPIRPTNPMWRRVVWSRQWYRWLRLHGGILYIFHNEKQERYFNLLQNKQRLVKAICRRSSEVSLACERRDVGSSPIVMVGGASFTRETGLSLSGSEGDQVDSALRTESCEHSDSSSTSGSDSTFSYNSGRCDDAAAVSSVRGSRQRNWSQIRRGVATLLERAERHIVGKSVSLLDNLEEAILDPLQSLQFGGSRRVPFFNLENAIDCLNLSWETYALPEGGGGTSSRGDIDDDEGTRESAGYIASTPRALPNGEGDDASGSGKGSGLPGATVRGQASDKEEDIVSQAAVSDVGTQSIATAGDILSVSALPTISTAQYGYRQIAVFEALDVLVVLSVMDTQLECHRDKFPLVAVAFRGTTNMSNARENFRVRQRPWREVDGVRQWWGLKKRAKVHSGFLNIWISLKVSVLRALRKFLMANSSTVYRVFCTGHSMGGAVACLCAYSVRRMLRHMKYPLDDVTVYTFGQPLTGNSAFQAAYDKAIPRTFRVVNESDAISFFSLFGGTHVGIEVDIDRHGNYICKPMFIERLFRPTQGKGFALQNHTLIAYAQSLNAVADRNSGGECKVRCLQPYVRNVVDAVGSAPSGAAANIAAE